MKKNTLMLFFLLVILQISCFSTQATASAIEKPLLTSDALKKLLLEFGYKEIPIKLSKDKNYLLIDIVLENRKIDKPFILDTGARSSSIDQQLQDKYKFKRQGKISTSCGLGGGCFTTYDVMIPSMQIGDYTTHNQLMRLAHYSHIKIDKKHIAGMLGLDFLRKYHAIVDVKHHRLFIWTYQDRSSISPEKINNVLSQHGYKLIQLKRTILGYQTLLVKINTEKPVQCLLDTGAPPAVTLDYKYATNMLGKMKSKPSIGKGSSNAKVKVYTARINRLSINEIVNRPQPISVTTGLQFAKIGIPVLGVIGLNWMFSHDAFIDISNDLLFAKNNTMLLE